MNKILTALAALAFQGIAVNAFALDKADLTSWNQAKEICASPDAFGFQNQPAQMEVICSTEKVSWKVTGQETYQYPSSQRVAAQLQSDKADMGLLESDIPLASIPVACPKVVQEIKVYSLTVGTSCDEVSSYQGGYVSFCQEKLQDNTDGLAQFLVEEKVIPETEHSLCTGSTTVKGELDAPIAEIE